MAEHAPAPWEVLWCPARPPYGDAEYQIVAEDYGYIASTWTGTETDMANAYLIAAAPEMLATLEEAREFIVSRANDLRGSMEEIVAFAGDMLALIQRARGEAIDA